MEMPSMPNRRCTGKGELFFLEQPFDRATLLKQRQAISLCLGCEHQEECLEYSLHHEEHGIWGGATAKQRAVMRTMQGITLRKPETAIIEDMRVGSQRYAMIVRQRNA